MMVIGFRDNSKVGGKGLTPTEEEAHFGLWCIMSSPLLIGCNLESLPESSLELLTNKELIALNQDPLGLQAYVAQHENEGYVLVKDIEQKRGNVRAVALYNPSDTVCSFSVPFSALEFGGNVKVRDLAKRSDLGNFSDVFEQTLPAHSAMFLRMEGETRLEPTLYEAEWAYLPMFNDLGKIRKASYMLPIRKLPENESRFLGRTTGELRRMAGSIQRRRRTLPNDGSLFIRQRKTTGGRCQRHRNQNRFTGRG